MIVLKHILFAARTTSELAKSQRRGQSSGSWFVELRRTSVDQSSQTTESFLRRPVGSKSMGHPEREQQAY